MVVIFLGVAAAGYLLLLIATLILVIGWAVLGREEWDVEQNRLEVQRRIFGFSSSSVFRDGELIVETSYGSRRNPYTWRLAVKSDGLKRYLISDATFSDHASMRTSREEVEAVARVLADQTGWPVLAARDEAWAVAQASQKRYELPDELRKRGFRADCDYQFHLTINPPIARQVGGGLVLFATGIGWTWFWQEVGRSFLLEGIGEHITLVDIPFVVLFSLMLLAGVLAVTLGIAAIFGRTQWTIGQDSFTERSRLLWFRSERQFVDAKLRLSRVCTYQGTRRSYWRSQIAIHNESGEQLRVLYREREDGVPRLLGAVLSDFTKWPLFVDNEATE
jgi:hypothetical protein